MRLKDIQLDSAGHYSTAQSYDSNGKKDYFNTGLTMNEYGMILSGKLFKADSSLVNSFTNVFDKTNYLGNTLYDSAGKESSTETVKNNDKGDQVEKKLVKKGKDDCRRLASAAEYTGQKDGDATGETADRLHSLRQCFPCA